MAWIKKAILFVVIYFPIALLVWFLIFYEDKLSYDNMSLLAWTEAIYLIYIGTMGLIRWIDKKE